jgi:hypothetical protein
MREEEKKKKKIKYITTTLSIAVTSVVISIPKITTKIT